MQYTLAELVHLVCTATGAFVWMIALLLLALFILLRLFVGFANSLTFHYWWSKTDPTFTARPSVVLSVLSHAWEWRARYEAPFDHFRNGRGYWRTWNDFSTGGCRG